MQKGLHEFLFKLLVLGYLMDTEGRMWKRSSQHLYVIEMLQHTTEFSRSVARMVSFFYSVIFNILKNVSALF